MRWTGRFVRFFRRAKTGLAKVAKWLWGNRIKAMKWLWSKIVKVGKGFCWLLGKAKTGLVRVAKWLFKVAKWLRSELVRVAKWLRGKIIRVAKWLRSELVRVAKWLFKVAKWLRGELVRVAKWLWGKLVVAGKWLVATMASENKKAIRSYAIGAGVLLLTVWLVDFAWDINILSRWWLVKVLLCPPALFLISLAQKRWEEEKIPVMWGLVKFFVIVIFAGWIIRSQDTRDFVNWCKGPDSVQVSKQPDYKIYEPGTYTFSLKAGEKTDHWITFPNGVISNYHLRSDDDKFQLLYDDGEVVPAWTPGDWPANKYKFKIIAVTDQPKITMKVVQGQLSAVADK